jgi:hypothetical protein
MTLIISMWSGPRNISTTMMRSFAARGDFAALDEPFYAVYLKRTGAAHPYREETLAAYPNDVKGVLDWVGEQQRRPCLFLKNIAYHAEGWDLAFAEAHRNFILIRDPRAMVASFSVKMADARPIAASYAVARELRERMISKGLPCPVVDGGEILAAPEPMLTALCAALGIAFDPAMLSWPVGARPEDGPWAAHWYDAVRASTGFNRPVEKSLQLTAEQERVAASAADDFAALHAVRLKSAVSMR